MLREGETRAGPGVREAGPVTAPPRKWGSYWQSTKGPLVGSCPLMLLPCEASHPHTDSELQALRGEPHPPGHGWGPGAGLSIEKAVWSDVRD